MTQKVDYYHVKPSTIQIIRYIDFGLFVGCFVFMVFAFSREPLENMKKVEANFVTKKKQDIGKSKDDFEENEGEYFSLGLEADDMMKNSIQEEKSKKFYAKPVFYDFFTNWSYFLSLAYLIIVTFCYTIKNDGSGFDKFVIRFHYTC